MEPGVGSGTPPWGGVIGAAAGVVACTLISNLLVNTEIDGFTTCTTKGYLMFGGAGGALGATIGALWERDHSGSLLYPIRSPRWDD
jgi:hypothetical protein